MKNFQILTTFENISVICYTLHIVHRRKNLVYAIKTWFIQKNLVYAILYTLCIAGKKNPQNKRDLRTIIMVLSYKIIMISLQQYYITVALL